MSDLIEEYTKRIWTYEALSKRGKFLTELESELLIDQHEFEDSFRTPGNYVLTYKPGSGKTSALRHFILNHINDTGIVSLRLSEDVDQFFYDLIAQGIYNGIIKNEYDPEGSTGKILTMKAEKPIDPQLIRSANWIICTHVRLFIEPPSLIFTRNIVDLIGIIDPLTTSAESFCRKYLFIDEFPSTLYKEFKISEAALIGAVDVYANVNPDDSFIERQAKRHQFLTQKCRQKLDGKVLSITDETLLNYVPTPSNSKFIEGIFNNKYLPAKIKNEIQASRVSYFGTFLIEKLNELHKKEDKEDLTLDSREDSILYSLNDIKVNTKVILDGTGDLVFKDSEYWKLIPNKHPNKLLLEDEFIHLIKLISKRHEDPAKVIASEYADVIKYVISKNPGKHIIVYMYKTSKFDDIDLEPLVTSLVDKKCSNLEGYDINNISYITYQSGKEKGSNSYQNASVIVILGRFRIPNIEISKWNKLNGTDIQSEDFTLSLLIQLIYRSSLRVRLPIKLYMDYELKKSSSINEESFLDNFQKYMNSSYPYKLSYKSKLYRERTEGVAKETLKLIRSYPELILKDDGVRLDIALLDLKEILGIKSRDKDKVKVALKKLGLKFEWLGGRIGNAKTSKTIISIIL